VFDQLGIFGHGHIASSAWKQPMPGCLSHRHTGTIPKPDSSKRIFYIHAYLLRIDFVFQHQDACKDGSVNMLVCAYSALDWQRL
jgi:hypothetical protein